MKKPSSLSYALRRTGRSWLSHRVHFLQNGLYPIVAELQHVEQLLVGEAPSLSLGRERQLEVADDLVVQLEVLDELFEEVCEVELQERVLFVPVAVDEVEVADDGPPFGLAGPLADVSVLLAGELFDLRETGVRIRSSSLRCPPL